MRKFLSLIVVMMLAFNVKAQGLAIIEAADFTFSDNGTEKTLFEVLDGGQHALLYFFNCGTNDYTSLINNVYEDLDKNQKDVYMIGLDPANESALLNNWATLNAVEYPLVAKDKAYSISQTYGGMWGVMMPALVLIAPNHDIILEEIWPITSAEQVVGIINDNLVTGDDNTGDDDGDEPDTPGDGGDEGDDNPSTPVEPVAPTVVATTTETTITLTWNAVDGATEYNIYTPDGFDTHIYGITETTYTFEDLMPGKEYCFKVSAVYPTDESNAVEVCATTKNEGSDEGGDEGDDPNNPGEGGDDNTGDEGDDEGDDPNNPGEGGDDNTGDEGDDEGDDNPSTPIELAVPQNLVATATETTITLTWDAVDGATKYNIYTPSSFDSDVLGITETTYTFENLAEGRYCFKVSACEDLGYESDTAEACATVGEEPGEGGEDPETPVDPEEPGDDPEEPGDNPSDPFNPATPTVVATTTETTITLTWDAVDGATEYNIYTPSNFDSNVLGITETTYTFENLITGVEYCFQVSAVSLTGESDAARVCATPGDEEEPVAPAAPVVVADTVTETTVVLTWNAVENATSYNVYMDTVLVANVTDTTYTVDSLTAETTYNFTVTALNNTLESAASNVVTVTTLKVEGIVENTIAFSIYPNPVNDKINIETEVEVEEVVVYTITGVVAGHQSMVNGQQSTVIDVTNLNSGIYFVKVVTSEGEIVKRIVKK